MVADVIGAHSAVVDLVVERADEALAGRVGLTVRFEMTSLTTVAG